MIINRSMILEAIGSDLGSEEHVLAIWLEGSDGTNSLDEYSDIDLVCYTKEGFIEDTFAQLEACLNSIGQVDIAYEEPGRPGNNRYKVYHLQEASDYLLIDVTIQSESHPVILHSEDSSVVPVVLLDKAGIVRYQPLDRVSHNQELQAQLSHAQGLFSQRSRAVKYTKRGLFLESLIYYQKFVLRPLVDVLRIIHTPYQADCFLVHATRDFPEEVVRELEHLYGVQTAMDIAERFQLAVQWFHDAVAEALIILSDLKRDLS